ncbi:MAG: hypothetical protein HYX91_05845 [Chloroflexi bacterium]|nr:hypothetical protein [Chloroflexota bacterium]
MKRYCGGDRVPRGIYMNMSSWEFEQFYGERRILDGGKETAYIRVPAAIAATFGPLAGLAFVIFLPLAGIVGIVSFAGYKLSRLTRGHKVEKKETGVADIWDEAIAELDQELTGADAGAAEKAQVTPTP